MATTVADISSDVHMRRARYRAAGRAAPLTLEPRYRTGEVKITLASLVMLEALREFPRYTAPSLAAWYRSMTWLRVEYLHDRYPPGGRELADCANPCWVVQKRVGHRVTARLTKRGLAILERRVPTRVVGLGPHTSLAEVAARARKPAYSQADLQRLERLRSQMLGHWEQCQQSTRGWAEAFGTVVRTVEATLNLVVAAECELATQGDVRTMATRAVAALDGLEKLGSASTGSWKRTYPDEFYALQRVAGMVRAAY